MSKIKEISQEKKDRNFVKVFRPFMDEIGELGSENPRALQLFMFFLKHMDGANALCVSRQCLSEILNMSEKTISRAVKHLKDKGWICVLKSGTSNVYIINPDVSWTSYADQKSYCRFKTNVIVSSSENAEYLKNPLATNHFKTIDSEFVNALVQNQKEFESKQMDVTDFPQYMPNDKKQTS